MFVYVLCIKGEIVPYTGNLQEKVTPVYKYLQGTWCKGRE